MRCNNCGKVYNIFWDNNNNPRPQPTSLEFNMFLERFKQDGIEGRPNVIKNKYTKFLEEG